jgi:hypothetical protein
MFLEDGERYTVSTCIVSWDHDIRTLTDDSDMIAAINELIGALF